MPLSLAEVRSAEPLRQYNYELIIPNVPNGGGGESLRIQNMNTSIPGFSHEEFESNRGGHVVKHAGRVTFPRALSATYEETEDMTITKILKAWHNLILNSETGVGSPASTYKTQALLRIFKSDGSLSTTFKFTGFWCQDVADGSLDGGSGEKVEVGVTFSYDEFTIE